jgi:hypothetical protein
VCCPTNLANKASRMMSWCFQKSGSSSKPAVSYGLFYFVSSIFNRKVLYYCSLSIGVVAVVVSYYLYLDGKYLVDEVLDGIGPRELTLREKLTIRVVAPLDLQDLNTFVLEHSVCQPVHEIQIVWLHSATPPPISYFKFPHTHSKVSFHTKSTVGAYDVLYSSIHVDTDGKDNDITRIFNSTNCAIPDFDVLGVLLLDADVIVPCQTLSFTQSVWRSSKNAMVGYFPRLLLW